MGQWDNEAWTWNLIWRRHLRSTEIPMANELLNYVSSIAFEEDQHERWVWNQKQSDVSLVKFLYTKLRLSSPTQPLSRILRSFMHIWKSSAPFKCQVLGWRLIRNRLPTADNLRKRNVQLGTTPNCRLCGEVEESITHLFILCPKVRLVWEEIIAWIGISWVSPGNLSDHLHSFSFSLGGGRNSRRLCGLWNCIVWVWWKWRNALWFDNIDVDIQKIIEEIKRRTWNWCSIRDKMNNSSSFVIWSNSKLNRLWPAS